MSTRTLKFLFWLTTVALVTACVIPSIAAPLPTANPQQVGDFIAQTANAASTQTARALPSLTPTVTITPTRATATASPTATSTIIFILASPTKIVPPTLVIIPGSGSGGTGGSGSSGGSGSTADNYACQIVSVSPANGTSFKARDNFDATWRVKNSGGKDWDRNSVDFVFLSGTKMHKVAGYDLKTTVDTGETVDLIVDMVAPKTSGSYSTTWTLRVGTKNFCSMSITIRVK
jgi:hypothetical protein